MATGKSSIGGFTFVRGLDILKWLCLFCCQDGNSKRMVETKVILCQIAQKMSPLVTDFDEKKLSAHNPDHSKQNDSNFSKFRPAVSKIQEFENWPVL